MLAFAEGKTNLGALGCRLIDGSGSFLPESKRNIPTPWVAFRKLLGWEKSYYATDVDALETARVEVLVGAFMCIKRSVFHEAGGFDEAYFMYGEDIDLSYSLMQKGLNNYYFGNATAVHFKGESTSKDANYRKRFYGAMYLFFKKHFNTNPLFGLLVWFGIKIASLKGGKKEKPSGHSGNLLYYGSASVPDSLRTKFGEKLKVLSSGSHPDPRSTVIFDPGCIDFKTIINCMDKWHTIAGIKFLIKLKNTDILIGSHHSSSRGEVVNCAT